MIEGMGIETATARRAVVLVGERGAELARAVRGFAPDAVMAADADAAALAVAGEAGDTLLLVGAPDAVALLKRLGGEATHGNARVYALTRDAEIEAADAALAAGARDILPSSAGMSELRAMLFPESVPPGARESSLLHGGRLAELSVEVARIAKALDGMAQSEAPAAPAGSEPAAPPMNAGQLRGMIRARRAREQYFPDGLFADPAWDILLDLMAARLETKRVSVSSLCIAAAVPATTALRWIKSMTDEGLLERRPDPVDGRRVFIDLSDKAAGTMSAYLASAARAAPAI